MRANWAKAEGLERKRRKQMENLDEKRSRSRPRSCKQAGKVVLDKKGVILNS